MNETTLLPDTERLIDDFAAALKEKLLRAQIKYGYGDRWQSDDWQEKCQAELIRHVDKGDPRDVAAYAAFCWFHSWNTRAPRWLPISEAPRDGTNVLAYWLRSYSDGTRYEAVQPYMVARFEHGLWWPAQLQSDEPTHFMPLPAPPAEGADATRRG